MHKKRLSITFRKNIRNIGGTVEQRWWNNKTSDDRTVEQRLWKCRTSDGATVEHLIVEQ